MNKSRERNVLFDPSKFFVFSELGTCRKMTNMAPRFEISSKKVDKNQKRPDKSPFKFA